MRSPISKLDLLLKYIHLSIYIDKKPDFYLYIETINIQVLAIITEAWGISPVLQFSIADY